MKNSGTILKLVPSLRARKLPDGRVVLTEKFIQGVNEFHKMWVGPLHVYLECSEQQYANLDEVAVSPGELSFHVHLLTQAEIARAIVADRDAVVLLSLDDHRQSGLGSICRQHGVACAYVSEYSLATRKQIVNAGTSNPLKRLRRKIWESGEERKRRAAVQQVNGLQCNGTPTYESYRELCPDTLLYFDTRVSEDLLATEEGIRKRVSETGPGKTLRLLFSGRLVASKGAGQLVDVAKALRDRKVKFHLSICGDGDLRKPLQEQVDAAQLNEFVSLPGVLDFKSQLVPFVKSQIDMFVCCHPQGDPSCTYLETMSCGVPIAGYANEAFEGVVRHSNCGWTAPVNQPAALADRIAEVSSTPGLLLEMSVASLAFAREHTFDRTFSRRLHHLQALADGAGKAKLITH